MIKIALIICLYCITLLSTNNAMAQKTTMQEVVYLNNGSIIKGIIIETVPNKHLKIQTQDGSVFVYKFDEIAKITKEFNARSRNRNILTRNENITNRYYASLEVGFIF